MGALAPVLTPTEPGERRSFMVCYPILRQSRRGPADRHAASGPPTSATSCGAKAKVKQRAKASDETEKVRGLDAKLARGNALTRPYAVVHGHRPQDRPGRRVRARPGRVRPPGRVRAAAPGPGPGRRVRRLDRPARGQPHPQSRLRAD